MVSGHTSFMHRSATPALPSFRMEMLSGIEWLHLLYFFQFLDVPEYFTFTSLPPTSRAHTSAYTELAASIPTGANSNNSLLLFEMKLSSKETVVSLRNQSTDGSTETHPDSEHPYRVSESNSQEEGIWKRIAFLLESFTKPFLWAFKSLLQFLRRTFHCKEIGSIETQYSSDEHIRGQGAGARALTDTDHLCDDSISSVRLEFSEGSSSDDDENGTSSSPLGTQGQAPHVGVGFEPHPLPGNNSEYINYQEFRRGVLLSDSSNAEQMMDVSHIHHLLIIATIE